MLLADLAHNSLAVAATAARSAKTALITEVLRRAEPDEVPVVVSYLAGELRQRRTGIGGAALRDRPPPADRPSLTVLEVDAAYQVLAGLQGPGSVGRRREQLRLLFERATEEEQRFLVGLTSGELRQGALESLVVDALARATDLPLADVRRAVMLRGDPGPVAEALLRDGAAGLALFRLEVGRPIQPMLAQTAKDTAAAAERLGRCAWEWKLDGIRVQIHRDGDQVRIFTRSLDEITGRMPELVEMTRALPADSLVLDGEAIALRPDGRPRPFQETASRTASLTGAPLSLAVFDLLHLDGRDLLGEPAERRYEIAADLLPADLQIRRTVTGDPAQAQAFLRQALDAGHEGVVAKALDAPYEAGRRGAGWIKVKPVHTLDLVVTAAEWGSGRRRGWLSNLHLAARGPDGGLVMLGKTFKGLTDELLRWQTQAFLDRETGRNDWQVFVRPDLVVEIALDGVQTSTRYPGGVALRFARVVRYRPDKTAEQADTLDTVRALLPG